MRNNNVVFMSALNAANNQASAAIDSSNLFSGSIQASFSSSGLSGTLTLQGSNDPISALPQSSGAPVPVNWSNIGTPSVVAAGAVTMQTVQQLNYRWLRVTWTKDAGTGTLTVNGFFLGF